MLRIMHRPSRDRDQRELPSGGLGILERRREGPIDSVLKEGGSLTCV